MGKVALVLVASFVAFSSAQRYSKETYDAVDYLLSALSDQPGNKAVCDNPLYLGYSSEGVSSVVLRAMRLQCGRYVSQSQTTRDVQRHFYRALDLIEKSEIAHCAPREVVIDVPYQSSGVFYPNCTVAKRCSGCCGNPCTPTRTSVKTIPVIEVVEGSVYFHDVPVDVHEQCTCHNQCERQCQPPFVLNEQECRCECPRINCPYGFQQDPESCRCCCKAECGPGFELDHPTCTCRCNRRCPPGYSLTESCQCEPKCSDNCQQPFVQNPNTCECECPAKRCPAYHILDPYSCECKCNRQCPSGYDLTSNCQCQPRCQSCPYPFILLDVNTCACGCPDRRCPTNFDLDPNTCNCKCSRDCVGYEFLDHVTCTCLPTCLLYCAPPFTLDSSSCSCQCSLSQSSCSIGERFDQRTCACVPSCDVESLNCQDKQEVDLENCRCSCIEKHNCGGQFERFNDQTCNCECSYTSETELKPDCPHGSEFDYCDCDCVPY